MKKWVAILVAAVIVVIAVPVIGIYIVFSPFLEMAEEIDEMNSMDVDMVMADMMKHSSAVAFVMEHPEYTKEFTNFGVGGTEFLLLSNDAQLTIFQDADGSVADVIYICWKADGASDSIGGPDVAQMIGSLC